MRKDIGLYKAKQIYIGNWVYGFLVRMFGELSIMDFNDENIVYSVDPETISEYSGQLDDEKIKVFENDFASWTAEDCIDGETIKRLFKIVFINGAFMGEGMDNDTPKYEPLNEIFGGYEILGSKCIVIGNVIDNPELIEVTP